MNIQSLIRDYKQALSDYELASKKKDYIREQFLKIVEWTPGSYGELLVSKSKQAPVVEWKELARDINLGEEIIKKYTIYRPELLRVSVKRSIQVQA